MTEIMTPTLSGTSITSKTDNYGSPDAASGAPVLAQERRAKKGWSDLLATLEGWAKDPSKLEDEGIDAPSPDSIEAAKQEAIKHRDSGDAPAFFVAVSVEGGVVFEWRNTPMYDCIRLEISSDGRKEWISFRDGEVLQCIPVEDGAEFMAY